MSCSKQKENSKYENLLDYQGKYEYIGQSTLTLEASEFDTILYAVIDGAKYPLKQISKDSFLNNQNSPVVFQRAQNKVVSYQTDGQTFKLLDSNFEKLEFLPRRRLFGKSINYKYQKPQQLNDGLEVGDIKNVVDDPSLIFQMIKETIDGNYPDVHSILIYKKNKLVLEEYFYGYDVNTPHQLRSATKPFIGGVLGIAVDKGFIKSEKDKLLPYFNSTYSQIENLDDKKKEITIENFLMYRHGLDCDNNKPESKGNEQSMMQSNDWVKFTLDLPMAGTPGKSSSYCTGCPLTLGRLVEIATDKNIEDFAKENLFTPLDISNYEWLFEPNKASMTSFSQMKITPRDLVKLAKMYMEGGKWKGNQIISESWINKTFDMDEGDYGYGWENKYFVVGGQIFNSYLATGNGGQKINIWPQLEMITVFTGGNYNSYQLYGESTPPNEMIPKYILTTFE